MRRTASVLLVCALVIGAALWIGQLPGAIRFQADSLTVDASTSIIVFGAVLGLTMFYVALRLLGLLVRLPRRMRAGRERRRRREGDRAVTATLVALAAGHQSDSLRESGRARKLLGDTPQTLLLAAQASRLAGRDADAAGHFGILAEHKDAALLGLRGLLRMAIGRQDWAEADALVVKADAIYPNSTWLREERAKLAIQAGDWKNALALSGPLAPRAAFGAAAAADDPVEGLKLARDAWNADPGFAPAAVIYATRLRADGSERKAVGVLHEAWRAVPHPDIAAAALAGVVGGAARYAAARRLTTTTQADPESQLVLGRTALEANELADARAAADKAKVLGQRRSWTLVADVEARIHPDSEAVRAAWRQAAAASEDPAWRCAACGHRQEVWSAKCANCGAPGSLKWPGSLK